MTWCGQELSMGRGEILGWGRIHKCLAGSLCTPLPLPPPLAPAISLVGQPFSGRWDRGDYLHLHAAYHADFSTFFQQNALPVIKINKYIQVGGMYIIKA